MKLSMNISYEVDDVDDRVRDILEDIVNEEAHGFAITVRRRLEAEGVKDVTVTTRED